MIKQRVTLFAALMLLGVTAANAQFGNIIRKAKDAVKSTTSEPTNTPENMPAQSHPTIKGECFSGIESSVIFKFEKGLELDYSEATFSYGANGEVLVYDRLNKQYYVAKGGKLGSPLSENDPSVAAFRKQVVLPAAETEKEVLESYSSYVKEKDGRYLITFNGKSYGPYDSVLSFVVASDGKSFAAFVLPYNPEKDKGLKDFQGKMDNAKTDAERMKVAMENMDKMQGMQEAAVQGKMTPELVTNVPNAKVEFGSRLDNAIMPGKIVALKPAGAAIDIYDLNGKKLASVDQSQSNGEFFITSSGKAATYQDGTLQLPTGMAYNFVSSPQVVELNGKRYIQLVYYCPDTDSVMLGRIPI